MYVCHEQTYADVFYTLTKSTKVTKIEKAIYRVCIYNRGSQQSFICPTCMTLIINVGILFIFEYNFRFIPNENNGHVWLSNKQKAIHLLTEQ